MKQDASSERSGSLGGNADLPNRTMRQLLLDPSVGSYFVARVVSATGVWTLNVVAAVVVYEATRSAFLVGAVSIAQFGPQIFLAPYMGALADRGSRRHQAATGHGIAAFGSGALAIWIVMLGPDGVTSAWPVIVSAFIVGVGFAVGAPAAQALVPSLGRPSELPSLIVLITAPMTIGRTMGPALGAVVLIAAGPAAAFAYTSVSLMLIGVVVLKIKLRTIPHDESESRSVLGGFRYLRGDMGTLFLLIAVAGLGFGVDPIITLSPAIADDLGSGSNVVALVASAFGVGAALFLPLFGRLRTRLGHEVFGYLGLWLMAACMIGLALSVTAAMAVATSLIAGVGMMAAMTSLSIQIQERVPDHFRGRIMALWLVCFLGSRPIAAGLNGFIADAWSVEGALAFVAVALVVAGVVAQPRFVDRWS